MKAPIEREGRRQSRQPDRVSILPHSTHFDYRCAVVPSAYRLWQLAWEKLCLASLKLIKC